ncbi:MAG: hypothetical protein QG656_93 [Candidatus Hydrogenedentes bacterium]|nr:hypothetical protein [Candidatus Hydrogenedentota bacterium]
MTSLLVSIVGIAVSIPLMLIICGTVLLAVRMLRGAGPSHAQVEADEAQLIQEIHAGLRKMEDRVDALETILLEQQRKEQK